jgi:hypothetical protein
MPVKVIMAVLTQPVHVEDGHARNRVFADTPVLGCGTSIRFCESFAPDEVQWSASAEEG